jgi:tricorn protease
LTRAGASSATYFYAENLHGLDWDAVYQQYRPLLDHVGRREDLNELMVEMIAELHAGHNRVGGGDVHRVQRARSGGLLGANFEIDNDRWRIIASIPAKPGTRSSTARWPPRQCRSRGRVHPGHQRSRNERRRTTCSSTLQDTVDKQVTLPSARAPTAAMRATSSSSRSTIESGMRLWGWVEDNRQRRRAEATDGRVGYIYLPNTAGPGYTFFNRMFHAQLDREALIIDERSNGGGQAANYIVEVLSRRHLSNWVYRDGLMATTPMGALHGPEDHDDRPGCRLRRRLPALCLPRTRRSVPAGHPHLGRPDRHLRQPAVRRRRRDDRAAFPFRRCRQQLVDRKRRRGPGYRGRARPGGDQRRAAIRQLEAAIAKSSTMLETYSDDIQREPPPLPTELGGDRPADRDRNLERLQSFLVAAAEPCLDADEGLAFSVLDVDLAGRYEWWHHPSGVRIMRDIDWPRMKVEYRHVDADGETIAEGREWVSDMDYLRRGTRRPTDRRSLRYERSMIERWVKQTFCRD